MTLKNCSILFFLLVIVSCSDSEIKEVNKTENLATSSIENYKNKTLRVYTTAKDTELRLTKPSEKTFKNKDQP